MNASQHGSIDIALPDGQVLALVPTVVRLRDSEDHRPGPIAFAPPPPLRIELNRVPLSDGAFHLRIRLHNDGSAPLLVDVFAGLLRDLATREAVIYLPHMGGMVYPVKGANYESHAFGQLTCAAMLVQLGDAGVACSQEKPTEDELRYRTGVFVHEKGLPSGALERRESNVVGSAVDARHASDAAADLGGVACFTENVALPAGSAVDLGPYLIAPYRGPWTAGAARLRELRRPRTMREWPAWFRPVRSVSEVMASQFAHFDQLPHVARLAASWGAPVFHQFHWWSRTEEIEQPRKEGKIWEYGVNPWWAYAFDQPGADARRGGDDALCAAIREVHRQGSKILLYVTPWTLAVDSAAGKRALREQWQIREPDGKELLEAESVRLCPMVPEARQWIVDAFLRVLTRYDADGLFVDQTAAIGNTVCTNPAHRHANPYVWSGGIWQLFRELRARLDAERPDTVLLLEGASELLREHVDGYLCHSHSWTGMRHDAPVTRALNRAIGIFDSSAGYTFDAPQETHEYCRKVGMQPRRVEYMAAIQFASGIPSYAGQGDLGRMRPIFEEHQRFRLAYPEMLDGELRPELPRFEPPAITGYFFEHQGRTVLAAADTAGGDYTAGRRIKMHLPFGRMLFDRLTATYFTVENGVAEIALEAWGVAVFEVIP